MSKSQSNTETMPIYTITMGCIHCKVCNETIKCEGKWDLMHHMYGKRHRRHVEKAETMRKKDTLVQSGMSSNQEFYADLMRAMVAVNMPWCVLNNDLWRNFLTKYTNRTVPDESMLRTYLDNCYDSSIQNIRKDIADHCMWISLDETVNAAGQHIAHLMVGKLCEDEKTKPHLLHSKQLEVTNHEAVYNFVNSALRILLPNGGEERILILVTGITPHMVEAGKRLQSVYKHMICIKCTVHILHKIVEEVFLHFPLVHELITSMNEVFVEAPHFIEAYRRILKDTPLPPKPILNKWGTWIEAALFYAEHFEKIKEVVQTFQGSNEAAIKTAQGLFLKRNIVKNLIFIKAHLNALPATIKQLETMGLPLNESMPIYLKYIEHLKRIPGTCGKKIRTKLHACLQRNLQIKTLLEIAYILMGGSAKISITVSITHCSKYKYAPLTLCGVQRLLSAHELLFLEKCHQLTPFNLEKMLLVFCNLNGKM